MTSSAVFPWTMKSHGPPNCLQVIVFISLASSWYPARPPGRVETDQTFRLSASRCRLASSQRR
jgi:hypothetical protein